jgi:hypothetical protein
MALKSPGGWRSTAGTPTKIWRFEIAMGRIGKVLSAAVKLSLGAGSHPSDRRSSPKNNGYLD